MGFLHAADVSGQVGRDIRTYGGRLVRLGPVDEPGIGEREARSRAAARGRYGRNAAIQGAAAELFKVWAVTLRARASAFDARIVLCLHDELLVHAPAEHADSVARLLADALVESAHRWAPDDTVRFVADISVVHRWSDAKP
jgi:DNA polymerase-1